jgi:hypothetical protein
MTTLHQLYADQGQSPRLDNLIRHHLRRGELEPIDVPPPPWRRTEGRPR